MRRKKLIMIQILSAVPNTNARISAFVNAELEELAPMRVANKDVWITDNDKKAASASDCKHSHQS